MIKRKLFAIGVAAVFPLIAVAAVVIAVTVEAAAVGIRRQIHR